MRERITPISIKGDASEDVKIMLDTLGRRRAFPEVPKIINDLKSRFQVLIASNSDHKPLLADLLANKLDVLKVFSSEELKVYKPNVEFFRKVLFESHLAPEQVIYVGDSQVDDIYGPSQLGIRSIWINRKKEKRDPGIPKPIIEFENLEPLRTLNFEGLFNNFGGSR